MIQKRLSKGKQNPLKKLSFLFLLLFTTALSAQEVTVSGTVSDAMGPLPGVSVILEGTNRGVVTDFNGNYSITAVPSTGTLRFSFVGFKTLDVPVEGRSTIDVTMEEDTESLDEIVVVGYGTQRRSDVTGSIVSTSSEELREVPAANIQQQLQGRLAGVEIQPIGNRPGADARIRIRGNRSITGDNNPLVVVDGIPYQGSLTDISPNSIESIDVLKDASATVIYGSRGANGVILITTKDGVAGETTINLDSYTGINTVARKYNVYSAEEYRALRDISPFREGYRPREIEGIAQGRDTDWQDLVYQDGIITNHNLNISGGSETSRFSTGLGYFKETTVLPSQDFERFSLRANGDFNMGDHVRLGISTLNNLTITNGSQFGLNVFPLLTLSPLMPPYDENGNILVTPAGNIDDQESTYSPLLIREYEGSWDDRVRTLYTFNTGYFEWEIFDGFAYRLNAGGYYRQTQNAQFQPQDIPAQPSYFRPNQGNTAYVGNAESFGYTLENLITYKKTIADKHNIDVTLLYSAQEDQNYSTNVRKDSITADFVRFYNLGISSPSPAAQLGGGESSWQLESQMVRLNYGYDDRYLLTVSGRRDGSSRLGEGNEFHSYGAFSLGWNLHNEAFMDNVDFINNLKFRGGYGETSNQAIAPYSTLGGVSNTINGIPVRYNYGQSIVQGFYILNIPDPNLDWEYTRTLNLAVDFGLFQNRISGSVDWYKARTYNILYGQQLPASSGAVGSFVTNVGEMTNRGLEVTLSADIFRPADPDGFSWEADINWFYNRNELQELTSGFQRDINAGLHIGEPISAIYDYNKLGIWQLDEAQEAATYGAVPGQLKLEDINNDGVIDQSDKSVIGSAEADWQGGITNRFNWKGFDLSVVTYARIGGLLVSQPHQTLSSYLTVNDGRRNQIKVDYWTPNNPTNFFPQPAEQISPQSDAWTTLGYFDASFVKIRSINLGYTLSPETLENSFIKSLRLYVTSQNPFLLYSPYVDKGGVDPEPTSTFNNSQGVSSPGNLSGSALVISAGTPPTKSLIFGMNFKF
ncbi:SusC/RagA family TonB-linked outer membrane protein [Zunongwangia sp. H14]|uniref:SusC/RagA family TonB-linked outer membrane protein n=1 Tax=Zunongwangia sp. H14 TaxID=3240792 RepID=UPI0035644386